MEEKNINSGQTTDTADEKSSEMKSPDVIYLEYTFGNQKTNIQNYLEECMGCIDHLEKKQATPSISYYDVEYSIKKLKYYPDFFVVLTLICFSIYLVVTILNPSYFSELALKYFEINASTSDSEWLWKSIGLLLAKTWVVIPMIPCGYYLYKLDAFTQRAKKYLITHPIASEKNNIQGYLIFDEKCISEGCCGFSRSISWNYLRYCLITDKFTAFVFWNNIEPLIINTSEKNTSSLTEAFDHFGRRDLLINAMSFSDPSDEFIITIYNENGEPQVVYSNDQYDDTEE